MYELPRLALLLVTTIHLSAAAQASSNSSSTTENQRVGWTDNPSTRGTLNILESCLFTTLTCTWSVLHLNIPAPGDGLWTRCLRKAKWLFWTLIALEFVLSYSIEKRRVARRMVKSMKRRILDLDLDGPRNAANREVADIDDEEEGILLQARGGPNTASVSPLGCTNVNLWTLSHAYYANIGGIRVKLAHNSGQADVNESSHYVTGTMLEDSKCPQALLEAILRSGLSEHDIKARSNADSFMKSLTVLQILWLVLSVVVRKARNIASSHLEIITLAFSVIAVLIYATCWDCPQNVDDATIVTMPIDESHLAHMEEFLKRQPDSDINNAFGLESAFGDRKRNENDQSDKVFVIQFMVITLLFGGLHCLAWYYYFPTEAERLIWRCASIASTTIPCIGVATACMSTLSNYSSSVVSVLLFSSASILSGLELILYILARLALLAIAFTSLRSMPGDVYLTTWAKYLPKVQ